MGVYSLNKVFLSFFLSLSLLGTALGSSLVVDNTYRAKRNPQIKHFTEFTGSKKIDIVDIAGHEGGLSYSKFKQLSVGSTRVIINNSAWTVFDEELGIVFSGNNNLDDSAKVILLEITGPEPSELKGMIKVIGDRNKEEKVKLILVNPNGITCDGCSFVNIDEVELRTDNIGSVSEKELSFCRNSNSAIDIKEGGVTVNHGNLILHSEIVNIKGDVFVKGKLMVEAYFRLSYLTRMLEDEEYGVENKKYAIDISSVASLTAADIFLSATGEKGKIKISTHKILTDAEDNNPRVMVSEGDICIQALGGIELGGTIYAKNSLKIEGKLTGFGSLESGKMVSILSSEDILADSIYSHGEVILLAKDNIAISDIFIKKKGGLKWYGNKIDVKKLCEGESLVVDMKKTDECFGLHKVRNESGFNFERDYNGLYFEVDDEYFADNYIKESVGDCDAYPDPDYYLIDNPYYYSL